MPFTGPNVRGCVQSKRRPLIVSEAGHGNTPRAGMNGLTVDPGREVAFSFRASSSRPVEISRTASDSGDPKWSSVLFRESGRAKIPPTEYVSCFSCCQLQVRFLTDHVVLKPHHAGMCHFQCGFDSDLFVIPGWGVISAGSLGNCEQDAVIRFHIAIPDSSGPAPFNTTNLHPDEVIGVVDNPHLVGFCKTGSQPGGNKRHTIENMRKCFAILLLAVSAIAQDLKEFEKKITEFTLPNGLHFIILQRNEAPVISFHTYVNAGSVDDSNGRTGIAHMFEHMAFKGTDQIGSKNIVLEKKALANIEKVYDELSQEQRKTTPDAAKVSDLEKKLKDAIVTADSYVDSELYTRTMEDNGAVGLNASTGVDQTQYYLSYPSNRLELWFLMEADRFRNPVYREFYKERDVVREEKRMRSESSPQGELIDALLAGAFQGHPYKTSPAGFASDIENYRVADAEDFRKTYYVPTNMTIAIAGDVDPAECKRLATKYFGPMPAGPQPPPVITVEPKQNGERRVTIVSAAQPMLLIAYKRPNQKHADDPVFDVIDGIVSGGRTGIMYKELVEKQKIALAVQGIASFPGGKYPNLYLFYALPNPGKTIEDVEKGVYEIVEKLKKEPIDEATLKRVKTKVRAGLIRQLASNPGLASQLAYYHANYGNWRMMFQGVEEIEKVTAADVQRVAQTYLIEKARTVAYHVKPSQEAN